MPRLKYKIQSTCITCILNKSIKIHAQLWIYRANFRTFASRNIVEMREQHDHLHSNLNGYYRARVTQKFKWTQQCKNQVVAHGVSPWTYNQDRFSIATMKYIDDISSQNQE